MKCRRNELNALFTEWNQKQEKDENYNPDITGIAKDSFTVDGMVKDM